MNAKIEKIKGLSNRLNLLRNKVDCFIEFEKLVTGILFQLDLLIAEEIEKTLNDEYVYIHSCLSHTSNKEVEFIKDAEDSMNKKNAPKVRKKEYFEAITKAIKQINSDLSNIIND